MCHDDKHGNRRNESNHHHNRQEFHNENRHCHPPENHSCENPHSMIDPVECLKMSMLDTTEEAFQQLVKEKVKLLLEEKMGKKVSEIAEEIVDFYVKTKEAELQYFKNLENLDVNIRKKL